LFVIRSLSVGVFVVVVCSVCVCGSFLVFLSQKIRSSVCFDAHLLIVLHLLGNLPCQIVHHYRRVNRQSRRLPVTHFLQSHLSRSCLTSPPSRPRLVALLGRPRDAPQESSVLGRWRTPCLQHNGAGCTRRSGGRRRRVRRAAEEQRALSKVYHKRSQFRSSQF